MCFVVMSRSIQVYTLYTHKTVPSRRLICDPDITNFLTVLWWLVVAVIPSSNHDYCRLFLGLIAGCNHFD